MTHQIGNGSMPLRIGNLIDTTVYGGPYRDVPLDFFGVKMAEEIDFPHVVDIPTKDYCVPKVSDLKAGIVRSLMAMINEESVYVGCLGGIGRTGLFLAALAKVQIEYRKSKHRKGRGDDPVLYVRKHFIPHAVETQQQKEFIDNFDVSEIVQWLGMTQIALGKGGLTPAAEIISRGNQTVRTAGPVELNRIGGEGDETLKRVLFTNEPVDEILAETHRDYYVDGHPEVLVERTTDWTDDPEADSASEVTAESAQWLQAESLQQQIDELDSRVDAVVHLQDLGHTQWLSLRDSVGALRDAMLTYIRTKNNPKKRLTKQTWYEKIRSGNWFAK